MLNKASREALLVETYKRLKELMAQEQNRLYWASRTDNFLLTVAFAGFVGVFFIMMQALAVWVLDVANCWLPW